jgi:hypothetical protein
MEGGLINPLALIRTGAAKGVTSGGPRGPLLFVGLGSQEQVSGTGAQSKPVAQPNRLLWLRLEMGHNMTPVGPITGWEWAILLGPTAPRKPDQEAIACPSYPD